MKRLERNPIHPECKMIGYRSGKTRSRSACLTKLAIFVILNFEIKRWCPRGESNSHSLGETDFEAENNSIKSITFLQNIHTQQDETSAISSNLRNKKQSLRLQQLPSRTTLSSFTLLKKPIQPKRSRCENCLETLRHQDGLSRFSAQAVFLSQRQF